MISNKEEFNCGFDCGFDYGLVELGINITHSTNLDSDLNNVCDYVYDGGFINPPIFNETNKFESNKYIPCVDYRSLYPEPFEYVLRRHNIDINTFFKYKSKYDLVNRIFNEKIEGHKFFLIEFELEKIVMKIAQLEKAKLIN